jgi:membrane protease YdiL (CAAX protease family)
VNGLYSSVFLVGLLAGLGLFLTLCYVAEREPALGALVYLALGAADLLALGVGLAYAMAPGLLGQGTARQTAPIAPAAAAALVGRLPALGYLLMAAGAIGLLLLLPPVRRAIARLLPIDPRRLVHLAALHYALGLVAMSLAVPIFIGALGNAAPDVLSQATSGGGLGALWAQSLGFVILAALGVGLFAVLDVRATAARLGLSRRFEWRWWIAGTLAAITSSVVVDALWMTFGNQNMQEVERISQALFQPYLQAGLIGALTIGLSAGIGEEILFRGAAQPRLGLVFTSLLFAVVHTQYTISPALLQVFVVGLVLGLTRLRVNTTTSIGVHSTYNFVLALLMIYAPNVRV